MRRQVINLQSSNLLSPSLRNLLTLALGGMSVFAQAPYDNSLILFITLPLMIWVMDGDINPRSNWSKANLWSSFKRGWLFGFGYLLASLWWIGSAFLVDSDEFIYFMPFAIVALPAALAIYYGLGAMIARIFWQKNYISVVAFAFGFGVAEYFRGTWFTGFPWNALGYAAMPSPLWMQSVSLIGFYPLNILAILVFSSPVILIRKSSTQEQDFILLGSCAMLFFSHFIYGLVHYNQDNIVHPIENKIIKIVQPNIAQKDKWNPVKKQENFNKLLDVTESDKTEADIIIWPESTFPFYLQESPDAQDIIGKSLEKDTLLIAGGLRFETYNDGLQYRTYNSLMVINDEGKITEHSDKTHLLPFGEFLPFQDFLESLGIRQLTQLPGGFSHGKQRKIIKINDIPAFLPLICYEVIFPNQLVSKNTTVSPQWIINITNDGWFGDTPGPYQHLRQTQIRAVEERLSIFRSANSGISAIINPLGDITQSIALNTQGLMIAEIALYHKKVNKLSQNLTFLLILFTLLIILLYGMRKTA
jgi:apolipoprotein N-acyltransferase